MSIYVETFVVGPLETNCYVISDGLEAAVIDPGDDFPLYEDFGKNVYGIGYHIGHILLTHGHPDHCFYAGTLAGWSGAKICMHEADIEQVEQGLSIAEAFYDVSKFVPFSPANLLSDGDVLQLGYSEIKVLHTPGHSPGGLCFVTDAGVFCGDTIFKGSIGRTDFPGGSHEQLLESIKTKLLPMEDGTRLYPGHGPMTTVGRERATNPFLA